MRVVVLIFFKMTIILSYLENSQNLKNIITNYILMKHKVMRENEHLEQMI